MSILPEKNSASPNTTIEPKKSARLAQKRKLREESGTPLSEDDFSSSQCFGKESLGFSPIKSGMSSTSTSPKSIDQSSSPSPKFLKSNFSPSPLVLVKPTPKTTIRPSLRPTLPVLAFRNSATHSHALSSVEPTTPTTFSISTGKTFSAGLNFAGVPKKITEISQEQNIENNRKWFAAFDTKRLEDYPKEVVTNSSSTQSQLYGLEKKVETQIFSLSHSNSNALFDDLSMKLEAEAEVLQEQKLADLAREITLKVRDEQCLYNLKQIQTHQNDSDQSKSVPTQSKARSGLIIISRAEGKTITFPEGMDIPFGKAAFSPKPAAIIKCHIENCSNPKKYSCSRTGVPLCSLACYKTNLAKQAVVACDKKVLIGEENIKLEMNEKW